MKVFLTGATGFVGQALTRQLLARDWEVIALVRRPDSPQGQAVKSLGATIVQGDILEIDSMRDAMRDTDLVIHNAAVYEYGVTGKQKQLMTDINVTGTDNVLGLAHELSIPRTIYVSTVVAYGDSGATPIDENFQAQKPITTHYAKTEVQAHEIALKYIEKGLPLMIACPNAVIGPNDHSILGYFLRMYLNNLLTPVGWAPDSVTSYVHVDDLAEGLALVAEKGTIGEVYFLAGEPMTKKEMVDFWATKPGGFKVRFYIPTLLAAISFSPVAPLLRLIGLPAFISLETIKAGASHINTSSQKAKDELGWTHRSAKQAWLDVIDAEIELKKKRSNGSIISKLKPI